MKKQVQLEFDPYTFNALCELGKPFVCKLYNKACKSKTTYFSRRETLWKGKSADTFVGITYDPHKRTYTLPIIFCKDSDDRWTAIIRGLGVYYIKLFVNVEES